MGGALVATSKRTRKTPSNPIARDVLKEEAAQTAESEPVTPIPSDISTAPTEPIVSCNVFGVTYPEAQLVISRHDVDEQLLTQVFSDAVTAAESKPFGSGLWNIPEHLVRAYEQSVADMLTAEADVLNYLVQSGQALPYPFNEMQGKLHSSREPEQPTRIKKKRGTHSAETGSFPIVGPDGSIDPYAIVARAHAGNTVAVVDTENDITYVNREIGKVDAEDATIVADVVTDTTEDTSLLGLKAEPVPGDSN